MNIYKLFMYINYTRLISSQIILTASSPWSVLNCCSFAIRILFLPPLPSGHVSLGALVRLGPLWW